MKILMVAIPNHHFFQWVNQLKDSGHDIFWFDITDGGPQVERINWVTQIKGWKLKQDYPFRSTIKKQGPRLYKFLQKFNERDVTQVFKKTVNEIKPDIVHCFEMELSGLPIIDVMDKNDIPFVYSSWGSDMFFFEELGLNKIKVQQFLNRVNYLITDCKRDYELAKVNGFNSEFLGVFPGNGGLTIDVSKIKSVSDRNIILVKGYEDGVGKAIKILEALELLSDEIINNYQIIIYSADQSVSNYIKKSRKLNELHITIYPRNGFIDNQLILELMGKSVLHIASSISDGMPNALLEAMSMGSFPIQSNPGRVSEEIITHNKNGFLINNPSDHQEIASHIEKALGNKVLREEAQKINVNFINKHYNRAVLKFELIDLYKKINKAIKN
ncbi:glycosyltransferase [Flavivirga rizhaonensis]|uniref:Glycosyltransferase n=1 Tax=Flavivirga rizhaonensis TaxID=2559571 RepID=A0A4V3P592_9FLAO|nr:glycosyltransferase [Flavivirga rizhaonensis]TGV04424.1 glycosyltransferase [Flavivirga rizhaonensis]